MSYMFSGCSSLTSLDLTAWNTANVSIWQDMFSSCSSLSSVTVGTAYVIQGPDMFPDGTASSGKWRSATDGTYYAKDKIVASRSGIEDTYAFAANVATDYWNTCPWEIDAGGTLTIHGGEGRAGAATSGDSPWMGNARQIVKIVIEGPVAAPARCSGLFSGLAELKTADLADLDTSGMTNMSGMFDGCRRLSSLDVSEWDTGSVTDMSSMFKGCTSLETLDVSSWDTSKVTEMASMFWDCTKLETLDLSGWDTSQVTPAAGMFAACKKLSSLTVGATYDIKGDDMSPKATAENGKWRSARMGEWLERGYIASNRSQTADAYTATGQNPSFRGRSLVPDGMVGVSFHCDLTALDESQRQATYAELKLGGETLRDDCGPGRRDPSGRGLHGLTCPVGSVQMAGEIGATPRCGDGSTDTAGYPAREYVEEALAARAGTCPRPVAALAGAIADFGHCMQPFLAESAGWAVGEKYQAMPPCNAIGADGVDAARAAVAGHAIGAGTVPATVRQITYSLALDAETSVHLHLTPTDALRGEVGASVRGGDPPVAVSDLPGCRRRIEATDIPAHRLGETFVVLVSLGGDALTVKVSPLSYARDVLGSDSGVFGGDDARLAVTSLYRYWVATMAYRESLQNG